MPASYLDYIDAAGNALQAPHARPALYMDYPYPGNEVVSDLEGYYYPRASDQLGAFTNGRLLAFQQGGRNVGEDIAAAQAAGQRKAEAEAGLNPENAKPLSERFFEYATGTNTADIRSGIVTGGLVAFGLLFLLVGIVLLVVTSDTGKAAIKTTAKLAA